MSGPTFVDFLTALAEEQNLQGWVLFPMQDDVVELVARNAAKLRGCYRLVTPDWEIVSWAQDKRLLNQVAAETGIPTPRTWYPTSVEDVEALPISFPAIVKPAMSIWLQYELGLKALPAASKAVLVRQFRLASRVVPQQELMVQEVIPGDGQTQFSVAAFCEDGHVRIAMTARRTRQYPVDYGLSSCFVEAIDVPAILPLARTLLERLRLSGMVEVEFKRDPRDGLYKLLDVNVRAWSWHTLCIACGIDFAYIQYCAATGEPFAEPEPRSGYRWRRLITDVPAAIHEMRRGTMTPWGYVKSLGGGTVASVADFRDPLPLLGDLAFTLMRLFRRDAARTALAAKPGVRPSSL
jgi:predicted ATP-grasp superfamily ATP-dependent carboligase